MRSFLQISISEALKERFLAMCTSRGLSRGEVVRGLLEDAVGRWERSQGAVKAAPGERSHFNAVCEDLAEIFTDLRRNWSWPQEEYQERYGKWEARFNALREAEDLPALEEMRSSMPWAQC